MQTNENEVRVRHQLLIYAIDTNNGIPTTSAKNKQTASAQSKLLVVYIDHIFTRGNSWRFIFFLKVEVVTCLRVKGSLLWILTLFLPL